MSVTISGFNLEDTFINGKERNVKGTSTKIKNKNVFLLFIFFIETVGYSSGCWLIDYSKNIQTWNSTCILSGLSLWIIEVSWDSNNSWLDAFTEVFFSNFLHLLENHWWDLFSLILFGFSLILDNNGWLVIGPSFHLEWPELDIFLNLAFFELSADEPLSIKDSVDWISSSLIFGCISNESLILSKGDIWRSSVDPLIIGDDFYFVICPDTDTWVSRS